MKVKTSELTGAALDWAVAKCEGLSVEKNRMGRLSFDAGLFPTFSDLEKGRWQLYNPSENWAQGGPIIDREMLGVFPSESIRGAWCCRPREKDYSRFPITYGPTPLIAAMRCLVASEMGDVVSVPGEIL